MRFIARDPRRLRRSPRQRLLRFLYLFLTRLSLLSLLLLVSLLLVLTSLLRSPPPAALPHISPSLSPLRCGCAGTDTCLTAEPVGAFSAPHVALLPDPSLSPAALVTEKRRRAVRSAAAAAWDAYAAAAFGADELRPRSNQPADTLGRLGATVVEALGTLYIMRLTSRYQRARDWVERDLDFDNVQGLLDVHEVTTRILGGLVSAYQLTGDVVFLRKAEDLGSRLRPAFDTLNGVPYPRCRLSASHAAADVDREHAYLCEGMSTTQSAAGGLSLEFRALAFHSLRPQVRQLRCKAERAVQAVVEAGPALLREEITGELLRRRAAEGANDTADFAARPADDDEARDGGGLLGGFASASMDAYYAYMVGLWHDAVSAVGAGPTVDTAHTFSAPARGFYEYLTKAWRQGGGCEAALRYPLDASMHMLLRRAIYETESGDLYLRSFEKRHNDSKAVVEQAMCYLPAVFQVAAMRGGVSMRQEEQWADVAEGITKACVNMYKQFAGQLGGESARFNGKIWVTKGAYRLQADLVEALFYMWRSGGKDKYREEAWATFLNIDRECRVKGGGFTVLEEATIGNITQGDLMPSEFLGATLKLLYLTFSEPDVLSLDNWIFNRAGHPLLVTPGIGAINWC